MSDSLFWGHRFSILLHYLSVMFCFSACLTAGRRAEVWKPQSFQKEISCNQTILLLRKCETQSKLLLPHSYLEQVYFDIGITFYLFFKPFLFLLQQKPNSLVQLRGWAVSSAQCPAGAHRALETFNMCNLTCLCVWELTLCSVLLQGLGWWGCKHIRTS